jgi:hypothetical protein
MGASLLASGKKKMFSLKADQGRCFFELSF